MAKIDHIMVISHTHWDPEWYSTFEEYRMRLVDFMDKLLHVLENVPEYHSFMFDGQVSPLESYLELFPEQLERIQRLVKTGKLLVGPWFVLPDEYMIGPESHIRNLLLGTRIARDYGAVMKVGYLPDMAGHISQMPQILKGFGITSAVVWRGVSGYPETAKTEFIWRSPDGTEILAIHLPWAYSTGSFLFDDTEHTLKRILKLKDRQEVRNSTRFMLLMNGSDHEEPHPLLPEVIKDIEGRGAGFTIEHTSILEYVKAVKRELNNPDVHVGEMRKTETSLLMPGIQSTRMPIKKENTKTEVLLERWVEPLCTNAWLVGGKYPQRLIGAAWRCHLQNSFHDDIYGAHIDGVALDVLNRYKRAQEIGNRLLAISSHYIASRVDTSTWHRALVVFNPTSWNRSEVVEATIDFPQAQNVVAFRIKSRKEEIPFQILDCQDFEKYQSERNIMEGMGVGPIRRYTIAVLANNIPAFGYRAFRVEPVSVDEEPIFPSQVKVYGRTLENDFVKIEVDSGGSFTLIDKATNQIYRYCNVIEDGGDVGDSYTYEAPVKDRLITNLGTKDSYTIMEKGPIRAIVKIDVGLVLPISSSGDNRTRSSKETTCPLSICISISALSRYVFVQTKFHNRVKDHCLRVTFRPKILTRQVYVDGHFDVLSRDIGTAEWSGCRERPSSLQPQRNFVALKKKERGLAILNKALIQYEATDEMLPGIRLTLLRCIGDLSKDGLKERNGCHCGPGLPIPDAQCLGEHIFEYAIYPFQPSQTDCVEIHRLAQEFNVPLMAVDVPGKKGILPQELSFCRVKETLASAYKKAEDSDDLIVRLYNVAAWPLKTEIEFFRPIVHVTEVALSEEAAPNPLPLKMSNGKMVLSIPGKRIVSLKVNLNE